MHTSEPVWLQTLRPLWEKEGPIAQQWEDEGLRRSCRCGLRIVLAVFWEFERGGKAGRPLNLPHPSGVGPSFSRKGRGVGCAHPTAFMGTSGGKPPSSLRAGAPAG